MLRLWVYPINENDDPNSLHYIYLSEQVDLTTGDEREWEWREYDVSAYLGQTVTLYIGARNDGDADTAAMYVDEGKVAIDEVLCTGCGVCAIFCPNGAIVEVPVI